MRSPTDIQAEIAALQRELKEAKAAEEALAQLPPAYQLAVFIQSFGHANRLYDPDGGWYYEVHKGIHEWSASKHQRYLQVASKLYRAQFTADPVVVLNKCKEIVTAIFS